MRGNKAIIFVFSIFFSVCSIAQTDLEKLTELQNALDEIQVGIGDGENVDYRKITDALKEVKSVKRERDSLAILVQILRMELLLAKSNSEGEAAETVSYIKTNGQQANSYLKIAMQSGKGGTEAFIKGYYVVLSSNKEESNAINLYGVYVEKYPQYKFMLVQNKKKTWNHICVEEPYEKENVGRKVYQVRQNLGLEDAWWMLLD